LYLIYDLRCSFLPRGEYGGGLNLPLEEEWVKVRIGGYLTFPEIGEEVERSDYEGVKFLVELVTG